MKNELAFLGLARRAGKLALGVEDVKKALRSGKARAVYYAKDISPASLGAVGGEMLDCTREELGKALGISLCAVVALTDEGMAKAFSAKHKKEETL